MSTTSAAGRPLSLWMSTGMPRPLSPTEQDPSECRITLMLSQYPASASSTELSTAS